MKPLVSVCIPSYNASRYIGETVESVLDSTYSNVEVIVNDDASTDDTREIVEGFADERVRFFQNESNLGVPGNWNRALERASGEFVGLLNHDDLYGPFWLTFAVHMLERYPHIGWVATAHRVIDDKGQTLYSAPHFAETQECSQDEAFLCVAHYGALPGFISRQKVLEAVGYYDEEFGPFADIELFFRLALRYPLYYSHYPHAAYRWHTGNLSHRCEIADMLTEFFKIVNRVFSEDAFPEELGKYREPVFTEYRNIALVLLQKLSREGDFEAMESLKQLCMSG